MSRTDPIIDAIPALGAAIADAIIPLTSVGVYWQQLERNAERPLIWCRVVTPVTPKNRIGVAGCQLDLQLIAQDTTDAGATDLLATVTPGMDALTVSGYTTTVRWVRSPALSPTPNGVSSAAHVYRIILERE